MDAARPVRKSRRANGPSRLIGQRLRRVREEQGLSLRSLAGKIGVTASLLSQIETGQVNPSVDTLFGLTEGLGVPMCYFFEDEEHVSRQGQVRQQSSSLIVHSASRQQLQLAWGVSWESLLPVEEEDLEFMKIVYPPGAVSADIAQRHGGRDYFLVLSGVLTLLLGFSEYQLGPGDSVAFDGTLPHQLRNEGTEPVEAVVVVLQRHAVWTSRGGAQGPDLGGMEP
jgi:transcriptional regulator with XRE-family HTH domain